MVRTLRMGSWLLGGYLSWLTFCSTGLGLDAPRTQEAPFESRQVTLGWTTSSSPLVAGYYIYYGTAPGVYGYKVNAGTNTIFAVGGLLAGTTNYFTTTSYDAAGNESAYAPEVSYIVPGLLSLKQNTTDAVMCVGFAVAPGISYQLQASSDLDKWSNIWLTPIQTTNKWIEYNEPHSGTPSARFYRLMVYQKPAVDSLPTSN
jgi:hypothetical protein